MRLRVVIGGAEYLGSKLTPQLISSVVRAFDAGGHVPTARWLTGSPDEPPRERLFQANAEEVISLFLEYLEDSYGPEDDVYVPLGFESGSQSSASSVRIRDPRTVQFLELASRKLRSSTLGCLRIRFSAQTDEVLAVLEARLGEAGLHQNEPRSGRILQVPCGNLELESLELPGAAQKKLWSNYQETVLSRMGALLALKLPFEPIRFGEIFARRSRRAGLVLRRDLKPADVVDSVEGGNLLSALAWL